MTQQNKIYQCRKCSNALFLQEHVGEHNVIKKVIESKQECQIFIKDKLQWMNFDGQQGQILCPKCSTKLGHFKWHGDKCSCGNFVIPYIAFLPNKLLIQTYQ